MTPDDRTTLSELRRNAIAALLMIGVVTFGAIVVMAVLNGVKS